MAPEKFRHTREQRRQILRDFQKAFELDDERQFMEAMRKIGIKDEDPRFSVGVKTFRALRSGKQAKKP